MASENEMSRGAMSLRDNYFYRHLYRWRKIHVAVTSVMNSQTQDEDPGRRVLSGILGANICVKKLPADFMKFFSEHMRRAENDIRACLSTYMPADLQEKLMPLPLSELDVMDALCELIEPTSETSDKRRFEILRLLELTIEYAHLANQIGTSSENGLERNQNDFERDRIAGFLASLGLGVKIQKRELVMYLNPKCRWSCDRICWETDDANSEALLKRGLVRMRQTVYAIAKENPDKNPIATPTALVVKRRQHRIKEDYIYAVVQARQKGCFEAFAKRFRNQQGQLTFPADLFGFRIACFSKREMEIWADFFNMITIHKRRRVRVVAQRNKNAARKLRLFSHPIFLSGQTRELQYVHIKDLMNILYSTREENHTLYHLRWYREKDGLFEQMWPYDHYGVDWQNALLRGRCKLHVSESVSTRNQSLLE